MQTWDLQKRNRVRTGERGMIPVALPAVGVYQAKDGYCSLFVLAPGGADMPVLLDWMDERGMIEDLRDEPFASTALQLNMRFITQVMTDPSAAVEAIPQLAHINDVIKRFIASMGAVEAYEEGQTRTLLFGLVSTPADLARNTQLRARDWYRTIAFDYLDTSIEFPGAPYRLSETPVQITRPPRLGEHTAEVLAALE